MTKRRAVPGSITIININIDLLFFYGAGKITFLKGIFSMVLYATWNWRRGHPIPVANRQFKKGIK
jgi:hypothetical protein